MVIVLHAAPITWGRIGGLNTVIPELIAAQHCRDDLDVAMLLTARAQPATPEAGFPVFERGSLFGARGRLDLPAPFHRPDLVVFHSTYIPAHAAIAARLRKAGIRYIICPHGGMTARAQATRRWKKRIGNLLFFNRIVAHARAVQCLTPGEAKASAGWKRPLFVLGNGTHLPPASELTSPGRSPRLRLLFLGRLHVEYKGLDTLLDACRLIRRELQQAGAQVELRGPDWKGSANTLAKQISRLGLAEVVTLGAAVRGEQKSALLRRADLFLHPSRSEGHPSAVLEALGRGIPCLLTPATNMAGEVVAAGAGWSVEPSARAIADGINRVLGADRRMLQEAGAKARKLATQRYSWPRVAEQSVKAYRRYAA